MFRAYCQSYLTPCHKVFLKQLVFGCSANFVVMEHSVSMPQDPILSLFFPLHSLFLEDKFQYYSHSYAQVSKVISSSPPFSSSLNIYTLNGHNLIFIIFSMHATCLISTDLYTIIILGEEYNFKISSLYNFIHFPFISS